MPRYVVSVIVVIVAAGALGGLINFFLALRDGGNREDLTEPRSEENEPANDTRRRGGQKQGRALAQSVTLGIGAAFLVPLFLNMISSSLMDDLRKVDQWELAVFKFAGFCLVAAISSTAFIKTMSDRVLKEAKEAKLVARAAEEKAAEAQSAIEPILEKEVEQEPDALAEKGLFQSDLNEKEKNLLRMLSTGKVLRSLSGLAEEATLPREEVVTLMDGLKGKGLVKERVISKGVGIRRSRWYATDLGRKTISSIFNSKNVDSSTPSGQTTSELRSE